jgi:predicted nucleic acid-binding Zn ribbon protein
MPGANPEPSGAGGRRGGRPRKSAEAGTEAAGTGMAGTDAAGADAADAVVTGGDDGSGTEAGAATGGDGDPTGPELARAVLDAAQARRRAARPPRRTPRSADGAGGEGGGARWRPRGYSGPGPDPRDPQPFGAILARLVKARGWQGPAAEATVFGAWEKVVGPDVAAHSRPVKLADGELTVEAESTAWATQLRLLAASLLQRIAAEVGHNVVKKLHIHGPAAPSWSRGQRRVQGRGPRDTYG